MDFLSQTTVALKETMTNLKEGPSERKGEVLGTV